MNVENLFEPRKRGQIMHMLLGLDVEDHSSLVFEEDCLDVDGGVFRAKITAAVISQFEGTLINRMVTIEEVSYGEGNR